MACILQVVVAGGCSGAMAAISPCPDLYMLFLHRAGRTHCTGDSVRKIRFFNLVEAVIGVSGSFFRGGNNFILPKFFPARAHF